MNISELSIRKPVFAWMLMFALILFGSISFRRMGVSQLPDVDFPVVNINVTLEGAAPEIMETEVVDPLEDAVTQVAGVKTISSAARTGSANISLEFTLGKDIDVAVQEVQTVLAQAQRKLPKQIDPPIVTKLNPEDSPILWFKISSTEMKPQALMSYVRDNVKDQFSTVEGVGDIFLGGYIEPNLRVWVSGKKLEKYQLTATDIISTIKNEHSELPAGRIEQPNREWNVRTMGEALTAADFGNISINKRGGGPNYVPIPLHNVATIEEGLADIRRISRSDGQGAVGVGIKRQRGTNAVQVAKAARKRAKEIEAGLPKSMKMGIAFDSTRPIEESVSELNFTLALSALLTAVVCWIFLGSWSATLNVVLAIPTSIVGSFIILYAFGFTLNAFTLLGLSLGIGIVVDDAIMVLENIVRHFEEGKDRVEAALVGSREITFAAIAATAAIIAIFLPVAFMSGIIGRYLYQFGVTLSVAVLLSLLEALTLTPMRCSQFLSVGKRTTFFGKLVERGFEKSAHVYRKLIAVAIDHRWTTVMAAVLFCAASYLSVRSLKKEFTPSQDIAQLLIRLQTPVGSSLDFTSGKFKQVEDLIMKNPDYKTYYAAVGGFGGSEVNTGIIFLTLKDYKDRPKNEKRGKALTQNEVADGLRATLSKIKDVKVVIQDLSVSGFSSKRGFPIEFTIRGPEWEKLVSLSKDVMQKMNTSGKMIDIDSNYQEGMPEVRVTPDRAKAAQRGVSVLEINQTINALIGGALVGQYTQGEHRYDVRVRLIPGERNEMQDILKLQVSNNRGEILPLSQVVTLKQQPSLQAIYRENRERAISVFANVAKASSQADALAYVDQLGKDLPAGYRIFASGSSQTFQESFQSLIFALLLGIIVSYMVLASQFNSFVHPFTVLVALPFSVSGAFLSLLWTGQSLNIFSMIGLILLMGIVKKNSILLVDFTNQLRAKGMSVHDALMEAGPLRLRPILMTSIATIAGALPAALAFGPGAELRVPMAIAVIGGVFVSTLLTLFVVPSVYSLLSGLQHDAPKKETVSEVPSSLGGLIPEPV